MCFGGNDFLGLIISFLVFLWDFVVEVGFGAGGACSFLLWLTFLDLILCALMWFGFILNLFVFCRSDFLS